MDADPVSEATRLVTETWGRVTLSLGTMPARRTWEASVAQRAVDEWVGERAFPLSGEEAVRLSYTLPEPVGLEILRRCVQ